MPQPVSATGSSGTVAAQSEIHQATISSNGPNHYQVSITGNEPPTMQQRYRPPPMLPTSGASATLLKQSDPHHLTSDREVTDAATILEFLAWGRHKSVHYVNSLSPDTERRATGHEVVDAAEPHASTHPACSNFAHEPLSLDVMKTLLPDQSLVVMLARYHLDCLLWYHGSFHGPSFLRDLEVFYTEQDGDICHPNADLQWIALLFSVLTGSMSSGNRYRLQELGFLEAEQETLSAKWLHAATDCLNMAQYMANPSIRACEAIATLTLSAHVLGYSNQQSVLLASAVRIAQALGLHRLDDSTPLSTERERGRRLWAQLCSQDWFSIPFADCYSINPLHSQSLPPINCEDITLAELPASHPTVTSYCRFLNSIAELMPQLHDALATSKTTFTRYEQVMKYDRRMRAIASGQRPDFLRNVALDESWPEWVPWARRGLAISSAHKIIMIHRSFLTSSFTNSAFLFTRQTCIAASKTILHEVSRIEDDAPVLWVFHAFTVAACVTLCLDLLHRGSSDQAYEEHRTLIGKGSAYLQQATNSRIASRGARVLAALLQLESRTRTNLDMERSHKRKVNASAGGSTSTKKLKPSDVQTLVNDLRTQTGSEAYGTVVTRRVEHPSPQGSPSDSQVYQEQPDGEECHDWAERRASFTSNVAPGMPDYSGDIMAGFQTATGMFGADSFGELLNFAQAYDYR